MKHEELVSNKTMDNRTLFVLWDAQQAISAKHADNAIDRAKRNFTNREKWNKVAQMGRVLRYNNITFTVEGGLGLLDYGNGKRVLGASFGDFEQAICKERGVKSIGWTRAMD